MSADDKVQAVLQLLSDAGRLDILRDGVVGPLSPVQRASSGVAAAVLACSPPRVISTRQPVYVRAWREFIQSGACHREDKRDRFEDVVHFIMELVERRQSRITISGTLAGIAFIGKLLWAYSPSAGELGQCILDGLSKEDGRRGSGRQPLTLAD
ncbi:hypothetical protein NDU88_008460 [Pleurodeles waltl]|uniref:Uncharacterized protein n=1 Tax=Pleurodeles waltl TaxID=8319 RepID=A0AAV7PS85_PLEWA|nr:hypothetical protein NDU88_008460 [Pleurodeles waltl]